MQPNETPSSSTAPATTPDAGLLTVVLVEDSLTIRRQLLQRLDAVPGLRVIGEAADETTAIALVTALQPRAVLLDLSLAQGGSGLAVLKTLRKQGFAGQVHVLSHQTEAYRAGVLAAGANGFFDKAEELDVMLRQLTGHADLPMPAPLDADALHGRLDQTVRLALRDGSEVVVHVIAGHAAELPPLAAQLMAGLEGGDLIGWAGRADAPLLCVVQIDADDAPPLRERLDVLAPDVRLGRARLPEDALSAGGLIGLAALRALGQLPG
ncbi:MAG: response regulator transcription factor [Mitsuaria chitosanitabida]|uniref:response regulator n=1 Tax=Roseateles chitosanitabidus TaxID=65048 RepID=UPI001B102069|nr:response regulator transcription factor [Roseateles chitosanitabidus]MBO9689991.1 response regulator transcription factor [Roseateles chitosanitabidus]